MPLVAPLVAVRSGVAEEKIPLFRAARLCRDALETSKERLPPPQARWWTGFVTEERHHLSTIRLRRHKRCSIADAFGGFAERGGVRLIRK